MSGRFKLSQFNTQQQELITKKLHLEEEPYFKPKTFKKPKYNKKKTLDVFLVEQVTEEKTKNEDTKFTGDLLNLPFTYVKNTIGFKPNQNSDHTPLKVDFIGTLRDYQIPVCNQAMDMLNDNNTTILNVYPSWGKTVAGVYFSTKLGYRTIIMLASKIIKVWVAAFNKFAPMAKVWVVDKPKVSKKVKETIVNDWDVAICMVDRLHYIPKEERNKIGTLIVDECHMFCTQKRIEKLLQIHPRYIIALSATFERLNDCFHRAIEHICGTEKIIKYYEGEFKAFRYGTGIKIDIPKQDDNSSDWHKYRSTISLNQERNEMIVKLTEMLVFKGYKVLILTWLKEDHVYVLLDMLKKSKLEDYKVDGAPAVEYLAGNKKKYRDSKCLVGTVGKIGTGFDEEGMCENFGGKRLNVEIIAGSLKSITLLEQMAGRVWRAKDPIMFHLVDEDGVAKSQWSACRQWYTSERANAILKPIRNITEDNIDALLSNKK